MRRGLALILVVGVLAVLAVLGSAFAVLSRLERRAASQRVEGTRAWLLARSGLEDAQARLAIGQDLPYGGEDYDGDGLLTPGVEADAEVFRPGTLDGRGCPVRHALRPSAFVRAPGGLPALAQAGGKLRGYSGVLTRQGGRDLGVYALKVEDLNARIHVNGGVGNDVAMDGPNGFLVRLLDNLDVVVTGTSGLGTQVVSARPALGYARVADLKAVLTAARYERFKDLLATEAWVDPKVLKPQPMESRPCRWLDIDDKHKEGANDPLELSGYLPATAVSGEGTEASPWSQTLINSNELEGSNSYAVRWERNFVYAQRQLRPGPPVFEPRAPISLNTATTEVLAAAFLGLKGTWLETWDGSGGWEGGFGFFTNWGDMSGPVAQKPWIPTPSACWTYPLQSTEETPWIRTRLDYGCTYGTGGRPWYPSNYDPGLTFASGDGGKSLIQCAPLGRLKETEALTPAQARALAEALAARRPLRTWADFNAFVDVLPGWEDLNGDGLLDGATYVVTGSGGTYGRKRYAREDLDSDGVMDNQAFADGTRGLTFVQKDLIKAMANPNTDLNDFNPDANLFKEVDKLDLCGIPAEASAYVHTTELYLDPPVCARVQAAGRSVAASGELRAQRLAGGRLLSAVHRDTTQADFMRAYPATAISSVFTGGWAGSAPYPLNGGQPLVSYPEPQVTVSGGVGSCRALYDGQVGLGLIGMMGGGFRFSCFNVLPQAAPDSGGPFREPLVRPSGQLPGGLFPDGVFAEKDVTLQYFNPVQQMAGTFQGGNATMTFWVKPGWYPEASPRPHALVSLSWTGRMNPWDHFFAPWGRVPLDDVWLMPCGIFFLPARNNAVQGPYQPPYAHDHSTTRGAVWPVRSLVAGHTHALSSSETLHFGGLASSRPVGRLQAHRWTSVTYIGDIDPMMGPFRNMTLHLDGRPADPGNADQLDVCLFEFGGQQNNDGVVIVNDPNDPDDDTLGTPVAIRFGELASASNMNYVADATFANLHMAYYVDSASDPLTTARTEATWGRYFKEPRAAYVSPALPAGFRAVRAAWTEIPCAHWIEASVPADGWLDQRADDRFRSGGSPGADGIRDVRIDLEAWDDLGTPGVTADDRLLAAFTRQDRVSRVSGAPGRLYYKAVFVNDWDAVNTRPNEPLNVTPFLDDVTFIGTAAFHAWGEEEEPDG